MKPQSSHLTALPVLLADAASLHTIFVLFAYKQEMISDRAGMLLWWACLAATYGVLSWLLRKPRSLRCLMAVAAGGFCAQVAGTLLLGIRYPTVLAWACILVMWGTTFGRCCGVLLEPLKNEHLLGAFERTCLVLFLSALAAAGNVIPGEAVMPPAVGILLTLLALARSRGDHVRAVGRSAQPVRSKGLLVLVLLLLGSGAALCVICLADLASAQLDRLVSWTIALGAYILRGVERFWLWLASLLPEVKSEPGDLHAAESIQTAPMGEALTRSDGMLFLLVGAVAAGLLLLVIWLWKRGGVGRLPGFARRSGAVRRTRKSGRALLALRWRKLLEFLRFQRAYLAKCNTAEGLLVWLERKLRMHPARRRPGDTSRVFLLRARTVMPESRKDLERLADCLDAHYFGFGQSVPRSEIIEMRRDFRKNLRAAVRELEHAEAPRKKRH